MDQVHEILSESEEATPTSGSGEADFRDAGGIFLQSPGTTIWPLLDLPAGRYVALCVVPDPKNGMPHAAEGMVAIFDAGDGGTPTA
jgi:hypothetical protein